MTEDEADECHRLLLRVTRALEQVMDDMSAGSMEWPNIMVSRAAWDDSKGRAGGGRKIRDGAGYLRMTSREPNCIICMQDDGYEIVGPFEPSGGGEMMAFGMKWMKKHGDDPRWQTIYLAELLQFFG